MIFKPVDPLTLLRIIAAILADAEPGAAEPTVPAARTRTCVPLLDMVLPVLDEAKRDEMRKLGGYELVANLSGRFLEEAPLLLAEMHEAWELGDPTVYQCRASSLRDRTAGIGAVSVEEFAAVAAGVGGEEFGSYAVRLVVQLEIEVRRLQRQIDTAGPARPGGIMPGH